MEFYNDTLLEEEADPIVPTFTRIKKNPIPVRNSSHKYSPTITTPTEVSPNSSPIKSPVRSFSKPRVIPPRSASYSNLSNSENTPIPPVRTSASNLKLSSATETDDSTSRDSFSTELIDNTAFTLETLRLSTQTDYTLMKQLGNIVENESPLKHYEIIQELGRGATANVHLAIDKRTNIRVALKQIHLDKQLRKDLLVTEILVLSESKHENIVNFIQGFLYNSLWVVMEFMDGGALTALIEKNQGTITEPQIALILYEISKGLAHLHSKNIIHRDVKSDNVLISIKGEIKISDFGYCASTASKPKRMTMAGTSVFLINLVLDGSRGCSTGTL